MRPDRFLQRGGLAPQLVVWGGLVALGISIGLYAAIIGGLDYRKLTLVCLVFPLVVWLATLRDGPTILFTLLVVTLSFSARFRPEGYDFHPGGAEFALAPIDFPLLMLFILCLPLMAGRPSVTHRSLRALGWPFALFLLVHLLSLVPSSDPGLAFLEFLRLLKMGLLVLVVAQCLNSRRKVALAVNLLLLTAIAQGALATIQSVFHTSIGLGFLGEHAYWTISRESVTFGRAGGTLGHANVLANFFEMVTPIALALALSGAKGRVRLLAYAALLSGVVGTFLAFSRAGWVSLLIGLVVVAFQHARGRRVVRVTPGVLTAGLIAGVVALLSAGAIVARFTLFWEGSRLVRFVTAQTALNMLRSHPVLGVGANNYLSVSSAYTDPYLSSGLAEKAAAVVHNVLLLYGAELGLLGLVSFLVLVVRLLWLARRSVQRDDGFLGAVSMGIAAGMIALFAHGMWDWLFRYDPVYTMYWFSVGLLIAAGNTAPEALEDRYVLGENRPACALHSLPRGDGGE